MIGVIMGRIFFQSLTDMVHDHTTSLGETSRGSVRPPRDWEAEMLGGHLVGCSKVDSSKPILDSLAIQVKQAQDDFQQHFIAHDNDVFDIAYGEHLEHLNDDIDDANE